MGAPKRCTECRAKILIFVSRRQRKARPRSVNRGRTLKGHDLCGRCWAELVERAERQQGAS